jgi:uroporphyrinogen-III synthase
MTGASARGGPTGAPLTGYTVAVAAAGPADPLAALLRRAGARVVLAPAVRAVPLDDDTPLRAATESCLATPPDVVVAGTGVGVRGWLAAADGWGLAPALRRALSRAYLVSRTGPARSALRAAGLPPGWTPRTESVAELVGHLRARGLVGGVAAVQPTGDGLPGCAPALAATGTRVIEVPVHRLAPPVDPTSLHRVVDLIEVRLVDAVAFTSPAAADALLNAAGARTGPVIEALRHDVLAAGVGQVTAAPLRRHGVAVLTPARARAAALVRVVTEALPGRAVHLTVGGHRLTLRGHAAVVDGELCPLAPAPMAVLRTLARTPGRVLTRAALLASLPRGGDGHAVEMAVARLRAGLRVPGVVQTVVGRGYRLSAR